MTYFNDRDRYRDAKTSEERWEDGEYHDPRSRAIVEELRRIDMEDDLYFDWRLGGDGDNGEKLAYQLDALFEALDEEDMTLEDLVKKKKGANLNFSAD